MYIDVENNVYKAILGRMTIKDRQFLIRVFKNGIQRYVERIINIGFVGQDTKVLDAGCGFGQWSLALSQHNSFVQSIEYQADRVEFVRLLIKEMKISNMHIVQGNIEDMTADFKQEQFDYVFCYSVIYFTDWRKALSELIRVTKKGGCIYICANDVGWYYHLIKEEPNKTSGYNPIEHGISAFVNEYRYEILGEKFHGDRVVRLSMLLEEIAKYKECFLEIYSSEGKIFKEQNITSGSCVSRGGGYCIGENIGFFDGSYFGYPGVYELIIRKI
ncbi:class I SAM-dependent methyltransferase [Helicobacter sp.]|uniref:class I SAM-dependent methyltransferase n=1 Tax=Helicobacter sp. TaxID=218 RepID=UPI00258BD2D9|nr:class I SAM-dependent methyltransferase [Helicobacter sp.]MCI7765127.1 class I SAM-dependent methyltransferase [Helicobacter sp.]